MAGHQGRQQVKVRALRKGTNLGYNRITLAWGWRGLPFGLARGPWLTLDTKWGRLEISR